MNPFEKFSYSSHRTLMIGQIITVPVLTTTLKLIAVKGEVAEISCGIIFAIVTEVADSETGIKVGDKIGVSPMQVVKIE